VPCTDQATLEAFIQDAVAQTFAEENTRRQEDRDPTRLTMSGLGGCTRRNAYAVAGTTATDVHGPEEARAALLGTGIHDWFLLALARVIRRLTGATDVQVEKRVQLHAAGLNITGQLDLVYNDVLIDLKTVREFKLHGVRRAGTFGEHRVQTTGYAVAEKQAGRTIRWIIALYMDRSTGEVYPSVEQLTTAAGLEVIRRVETIRRFADDNPDAAPREARGPGVSMACNRCPWLKRCWGPDAVPGETGPQTQLAQTPAGLKEILRLYYDAAGVNGGAKADQDFAKLVLADTKPNTYGPYELRRGQPGQTDDTDAMKKILTDLGIPIPKKPRAGQTTVRLAKPPKEKPR
jgi:hypothetical protein